MAHLLLYELNPMIGLDLHDEVQIPPPFEVPAVPHVVGNVLRGAFLPWAMDTMTTPAIQADGLNIMLKGTDIGPPIPHVPIIITAFLLAPIISLVAGSESIFGPESVKAGEEGKSVACACFFDANVNLNCNEWVVLPTGAVQAWGTVLVDLTFDDIVKSIEGAILDAAFKKAMEFVSDHFLDKRIEDFVEKHDRVWTPSELTEPLIRTVLTQLRERPFDVADQKPSGWAGLG